MFGNSGTVTTVFAAKDNMSPVVRGIRNTMQGFKRDASTGFGLAAGISVFSLATKAIDFAADSLRAFAEEQASVAKLTTALRENAKAWDGNIDAVENVIRARTRLGFADDAQRDSLASLVAQIGDVNDALAIQRTAMDLARLRNIDLGKASDILAKAYNGSTTALGRMGIKLRAGVKGMEAIGEVQQRAAGQAKAYAETTQGAMEVSAIAFDEFKESVGGALNQALNPFFNLVVQLTNQTPDLDTNIGRLTQSYRDQISAIDNATKAEERNKNILDTIGDTTESLRRIVFAQDAAISDFTGTLGDYQRILQVSRWDLALFTEAGLTAGMSLDDLRKALDMLVRQHVADEAKRIGYAWQTGMDDITTSVPPAVEAIKTLPTAATHAVVNMRDAIKNGKAGIIEQFRDLAWQSKHPFAAVNYEEWLKRRQAAATRKMKAAAKAGRPDVVEQYRQLILDIQAEIDGLPGHASTIAARAMAALGRVGTYTTELMGDLGPPSPEKPPKKPKKPKHPPKKPKKPKYDGLEGSPHQPPTGVNAMGGWLMAGESSLVGENGPEVITLAGAGGRITPSHRLSQPIVINVDGRKLFEITDARAGRAIAMGG